jgi:hypothetical protein
MDDVVDLVTARITGWSSDHQTSLSLDLLRAFSHEFETRIHLAVMVEPYLSKVCNGEKYIESRLTRVNIAPYERAEPGDVILFKLSGGPIVAAAKVSQTRFEQLGPRRSPASLAEAFSSGLGYEPGYVESKAEARFASLLWLQDVRRINSVPIFKPGRQAWVTIQPNTFGQPRDAEPTGRLF